MLIINKLNNTSTNKIIKVIVNGTSIKNIGLILIKVTISVRYLSKTLVAVV